MSLINKMLQELDKRNAVDSALRQPSGMAQHLRPVMSRGVFGEAFWRLMAGVMVIVVGWIVWLLWQLSPNSVVTDLALQEAAKRHTEQPAARPTAVPAPMIPAPAAPQPAAEPLKVDVLKLATEIITPIVEPRARPAAQKAEPKTSSSGLDAKTVASIGASMPSSAAPRYTTSAPLATGQGKIDKHMNAAPGERAEYEYRRAAGLLNQGRSAEAMDALQAALDANPGHEAARQTAVGLLIENKHVNEAQRLLQDGLALNPAQSSFAMLLARIQVERSDLNGALQTLQQHAGSATANAEYWAFAAAILQRLERHKDAVEAYQTTLRLQPANGIWWMGLGISQQALNQRQEAGESFRRAKAAGNLSPDLVAFVDQRLKRTQ